MVRDGRSLDTLDRRGDRHRYYSSFGSNKFYDRHCHHPYRRSEKGYFSDEFQKVKPLKFNEKMKKSQDAKA